MDLEKSVWSAVREFGALVVIAISLLLSLMWFVYYLLVILLPKNFEALRADLVTEREKFLTAIRERDQVHSQTIAQLTERFVESLREERSLFMELLKGEDDAAGPKPPRRRGS